MSEFGCEAQSSFLSIILPHRFTMLCEHLFRDPCRLDHKLIKVVVEGFRLHCITIHDLGR